MNRADRDLLIGLARKRASQAKAEASEREKILLAEAEELLTAEYSARDQLWAEATAIAEEYARKANEQIIAQCALLGVPAQAAPQLRLSWTGRGQTYTEKDRRAEARKLAATRLAALTAVTKTRIGKVALEVETQLVAGGLESDEARAFLDRMPTAEELMPAIGLDDIGVEHWQPETDLAGRLLTSMTPADRRRRQVLRAIAASPGASDRAIGEAAGVDHKTVARYRHAAGELPAGSGE